MGTGVWKYDERIGNGWREGGTQYIKKEKEGMGLEYEGMEGEWEYQEEPESGRGERPGMGSEGWERRGGEMREGGLDIKRGSVWQD